MSGPEKPKVIGEELSDERIRSFLQVTPYDSTINEDFHVLIQAYQALRVDDFGRLIGFFTEAGRNLDAVGPDGETILDHISGHRRSAGYAELLKQAGAKTAAQAG